MSLTKACGVGVTGKRQGEGKGKASKYWDTKAKVKTKESRWYNLSILANIPEEIKEKTTN